MVCVVAGDRLPFVTTLISKNIKENNTMTLLGKPNTWISSDPDGNTKLTYAMQTNPAPLTVSDPGRSPELASLQFVVTNPTNGPVTVETITFILEAGTSGISI